MRGQGLSMILGKVGYDRVRKMSVLIVGAGGIGCELLKDAMLMGFGEIHVVDLDTIDVSNLNRQFLFRQSDVGQAKARTAVDAVQHFNDSLLVAHQGNIMDGRQFPLSWFKKFGIIFNALDNLDARRYVNLMVQFLGTPLLESGTAGFDGHIQPIFPGLTECFDCTSKETPRRYPVCTIRSTPSSLVHCVVWAKDFLFQQLFGGGEDETLIEGLGTDNAKEIGRIREESKELGQLQQWVRSKDAKVVDKIIEKLFVSDIKKLLEIENLWNSRAKPQPLECYEYDEELSFSSVNNLWTVEENLAQFIKSSKILMKRMETEPCIGFDKDDEDALLFVATAANIRAHIFHIPMKSVFDIKKVAGNIIPAIITTNAIIAGLSSLASLRVLDIIKVLENHPTNIPMAFTAKASKLSTNRYITAPVLSKPNPKCSVCMYYQRTALKIGKQQWKTLKLERFIEMIKETYGFSEDFSILDSTNNRLLADYDFDDLNDSTFEKLNLVTGTVLSISDEEIEENSMSLRKPIQIYLEICELSGEISLPRLPLVRIVRKKPSVFENQQLDHDTIIDDGMILSDSNNPEENNRKRPLEFTDEFVNAKRSKY